MDRINDVLYELHESESNSEISLKRNNNPLLEDANVFDMQGAIDTSNMTEEEQSAVKEFHEFVKSVLLSCEDELLFIDGTESSRIQNEQLHKMLWETAKLKSLKAIKYIPSEILVKLLTVLGSIISDSMHQVFQIETEGSKKSEKNGKMSLPSTVEKILDATNASICTLHILTSDSVPRNVYIEDVIDKIVEFSEFLLKKCVYPFCDQNYETIYKINISIVHFKNGHLKNKKANEKFKSLFKKVTEIVNLLSELLAIHLLTDNAVLHITSIAITPFYVENVSDLQFAALKLAAEVFKRYEDYRKLILNDILEFTGQLQRNKLRNKSFHLNSTDHIQMQTVLVLHIVQCTIILPEDILISWKGETHIPKTKDKAIKNYSLITQDCDSIISSKYESALRGAGYFLKGFLHKCTMKKEEIDYKLLFENFIKDLLLALNKPEWPVAELFINLLGHLLTSNIQNKCTEIFLRTMSLECLSFIVTKLKKESINAQLHSGTILMYLKGIKSKNLNVPEKKNLKKKIKLASKEANLASESEDQLLQNLLLYYLSTKQTTGQSTMSAKHFYIVKWYKESMTKTNTLVPNEMKSNLKGNVNTTAKSKSKRSKCTSNKAKKIADSNPTTSVEESETTFSKNPHQSYKQFLIFKIKNAEVSICTQTGASPTVDDKTAELITQYLATKGPLYENICIYLRQILSVLIESSSTMRAKAMKCLTSIIEVDPSLLERTDVHQGVCYSFLDNSVLVREAAVDLIGKYVLNRHDLLEQYYEMLSSRLLDTGISVRKRVLKILKDICTMYPNFPKIPEIFFKIARRMNDQESIKKLVIEAFQEMWFSPIHADSDVSSPQLLSKVINIVKVIANLQETELIFFEQLFNSLSTENNCNSVVAHESSQPFLKSCQEIVSCLIQWILKSEGNNEELHSPHLFVACFTTLHLFAKSFPALLVDYVGTLQPYLSIRCQTQGDLLIVKKVAQTIQHILPLVQHPSKTFVTQLEEDLLKLILSYDPEVIENCLSCLSIVINKMTHNFKLIGDVFKRYYSHLTEYKNAYEKNPSYTELIKKHPYIRRCLFTTGLLFRHFNFTEKDIISEFPDKIIDDVFVLLLYFLQNMTEDIQIYSLKAIGSLCISHNKFMTREELITLFHFFLTSNRTSVSMQNQVLKNLIMYLKEEDSIMMKLEKGVIKSQKHENLKNLGNVSSDRASKVIQLYSKDIMQSCLHASITIRFSSLKLLQLVIHQGLIQPFGMVPYMIGMATDENTTIRQISEALMDDTEKKTPGTMQMKSQEGFYLSFKLHSIIHKNDNKSGWMRGFRTTEDSKFEALNSILYSLIRKSKAARKAFVANLLKRFENWTPENLKLLLFIADNLAYLPYVILDEPLFVIYLINTMTLVCGAYVTDNLLEIPSDSHDSGKSESISSAYIPILKENGNESSVFLKVPEDSVALQQCVSAIQSCFLLEDLKCHLQTLYSISNEKIMCYSPEKYTKITEKSVKQASTKAFNPRITVHNPTVEGNTLNIEKQTLVKQYFLLKEMIDPDGS